MPADTVTTVFPGIIDHLGSDYKQLNGFESDTLANKHYKTIVF